MTFELIRTGWPNTAAILALAIMPIVALAIGVDRRPNAAPIEQAGFAAVCQMPAVCTVLAAAATPDDILQ